MLDYEKQRKAIVFAVLGIVLVIVLTIVYIILIWQPEPEKEKVFEVGVVESVNIEEDDMTTQYFNEIADILKASDVDKLCSLVGEDYLEYYDYTLDDVKKYIQDKKIMDKNLELVNSKAYVISGYSNVYYLDIKVAGEIYSIGIVIREIAPKQYTIAFDKFIDYSKNIYTGAVNSIGFIVQNRARFTSSVEYRVRITNNYDKSITINSMNKADGLVLVNGYQGTVKKPIMLSFANQAVVLEEGFSREYTATYYIEDDTDYILYNVLVLKDVTYEGIPGTNDLEFPLS